jgi:hypothetical protein
MRPSNTRLCFENMDRSGEEDRVRYALQLASRYAYRSYEVKTYLLKALMLTAELIKIAFTE